MVICTAIVPSRNDVFDLEILRGHRDIRQVAVFATASGPLPNRFTAGRRHAGLAGFRQSLALDRRIASSPRNWA